MSARAPFDDRARCGGAPAAAPAPPIAPLRRALGAALVCLTLLCVAVAGPAFAVQPEEKLADPALEAQAREISKGLRCVVCDNQSIDESDAQIAADMRRLVRERLVAGDDADDIRALFVDSYGEFVLLSPEVSGSNLPFLMIGPVALLIGAALLWRRLRPSAAPAHGAGLSAGSDAGGRAAAPDGAGAAERAPDAAPLSEAERERIARLMRD